MGQKEQGMSSNWDKKIQISWTSQNYQALEKLYRDRIEIESDKRSHYWNLGLVLVLLDQSEEAQTTWMVPLLESDGQVAESWTYELFDTLEQEAIRQESLSNYTNAWTIRFYQREIVPSDINNLLHLVQLSCQLDWVSANIFSDLGLLELLEVTPDSAEEHLIEFTFSISLLLETLRVILNYNPQIPEVLEFTTRCLNHIKPLQSQEFIETVSSTALILSHQVEQPALAIKYLQLCLEIKPQNLDLLSHLASMHSQLKDFDTEIAIAELMVTAAQTVPEEIAAKTRLLQSLIRTGGYWSRAKHIVHQLESLIDEFLRNPPSSLSRSLVLQLIQVPFVFTYFRDQPIQNREIHNRYYQIIQNLIEKYSNYLKSDFPVGKMDIKEADVKSKRLKVGYLSHCFRSHSVGWLSRWLVQYHNKEDFELHGYFINYQSHVQDPLKTWFAQQFEHIHYLPNNGIEIAKIIADSNIDILVELDSLTGDVVCEALALKPAPIQVSWLGWDAIGLPTIDYFLADSYVLPEQADDYYQEQIWRLPQSYVAVDGFEIGVPTLRRDQLGIGEKATIYMTAQVGYKRHPETVRLQLQILKKVPNSYLLVKGVADLAAVEVFFKEMAGVVGVYTDRLRFLPLDKDEATHRANLAIADVVLDTYPYNGATTTLETLWMGVPLVTHVGQQFSARNTYTMMMNAGIMEGIAWTADEYVEWGIRLGTDQALREEIAWKLRQSRQLAPLWNAKEFTRNVEATYQEMWMLYCHNSLRKSI